MKVSHSHISPEGKSVAGNPAQWQEQDPNHLCSSTSHQILAGIISWPHDEMDATDAKIWKLPTMHRTPAPWGSKSNRRREYVGSVRVTIQDETEHLRVHQKDELQTDGDKEQEEELLWKPIPACNVPSTDRGSGWHQEMLPVANIFYICK